MFTNIHKTQSILDCLKTSSTNSMNPKLFNLTSVRYFGKGQKGAHYYYIKVYKNITRRVKFSKINIIFTKQHGTHFLFPITLKTTTTTTK